MANVIACAVEGVVSGQSDRLSIVRPSYAEAAAASVDRICALLAGREPLGVGITLRHVRLDECPFPPDDAARIFAALADGPHASTIVSLELNDVGIDTYFDPSTGTEFESADAHTHFLRLLSSLPALEHFSFALCGITPEHTVAALDILRGRASLSRIDLTCTNLLAVEDGRSAAEALAEILTVDGCAVTHLDLNMSHVGVDGARALAVGLRATRTLRWLSLASCSLGNDGCAAIAEALADNATLEWLDLTYNQLTAPAYCAMSRALATNASLYTLVMPSLVHAAGPFGSGASKRDPFDGSAEEFGAVFGTNNTLKVVKISNTMFRDEFGAALALSLGTNSTLEEIEVSGTCMSRESHSAIARALADNPYCHVRRLIIETAGAPDVLSSLLGVASLRDLSVPSLGELGDAFAQSGIAACMQHNTTLETLCINSTLFSDAAFEALLAGVQSGLRGLRTLSITSCSLDATRIAALLGALGGHLLLASLDLRMNVCGGVGVAALSTLIKGCPSLRTLKLVATGLGGPHALDGLVEALSDHACPLEELDLSCNDAIDANAVARIVASTRVLKTLNLAHCTIGSGGAQVAEAMRGNTSLCSVSFEYAEMTASCVAAFVALLAANTPLVSLDLSGNFEMGYKGRASLLEARAVANTNLQHLLLYTCDSDDEFHDRMGIDNDAAVSDG
eukprot:Opistho-2@53331